MRNNWIARVVLAVVACAGAMQAAPIRLGLIQYKYSPLLGTATRFSFNNWTNGIAAYDVMTPVDFLNVSFTVDEVGQPPNQVQGGVPTTMGPSPTAYSTEMLSGITRSFTRAVFTATLNPAATWQLRNGSIFTPSSSTLQMVLLPLNGGSFQPGIDSWEITVGGANDPPGVPEPATFVLAGIGLAGAVIYRRRRSA